MNACSFCKHRKRKCDRTRPKCSNCLRLHQTCTYPEDSVQTSGPIKDGALHQLRLHKHDIPSPSAGVSLFSHGTLQQTVISFAMQAIGSFEELRAVSADFFATTYLRIPTISKIRFLGELESFITSPSGDFALLCLCVLLIQQTPLQEDENSHSPLYVSVKAFLNCFQASERLSMNFVHSNILVSFYETGHGLHTAAYMPVSTCARMARMLGFHRKIKRDLDPTEDKIMLEEQRRVWWAIVVMDRFINLCAGDALFVTGDLEISDLLPVGDQLWAETPLPELEAILANPPSLETPFNTTVGQMARECQISHLAGRVVRHVFDPMPDQTFTLEEGLLLERSLRSFLPLLANENLTIGKYCSSFGMCNSALFLLYEFMLNDSTRSTAERDKILQSMEETSIQAIAFATASYNVQGPGYPRGIHSPYFTYSIYQAAIVQHRLWRQTGLSIHKEHLDLIKSLLRKFTDRWKIAWKYLNELENIKEAWPPITIPFQRLFISNGKQRI